MPDPAQSNQDPNLAEEDYSDLPPGMQKKFARMDAQEAQEAQAIETPQEQPIVAETDTQTEQAPVLEVVDQDIQPSPQEAPPTEQAPAALAHPVVPKTPVAENETPGDKLWRLRCAKQAEISKKEANLHRLAVQRAEALELELQTLKAQVAAQPPVAPTPPPESEALKRLKEEYGDDADLIADFVREQTATAAPKLVQEQVPASQSHQQVPATQEYDVKVESFLDERKPNWRDLYNDTLFPMFLQERGLEDAWADALSAARGGRMENCPLLLNAINAFEGSELNFAEATVAQNPLAALSQPETSSAAVTQQKTAAQTTLEQQIVPISGGGAAPAAPRIQPPVEAPELSNAQIRKLTQQMHSHPDPKKRAAAERQVKQFLGEPVT